MLAPPPPRFGHLVREAPLGLSLSDLVQPAGPRPPGDLTSQGPCVRVRAHIPRPAPGPFSLRGVSPSQRKAGVIGSKAHTRGEPASIRASIGTGHYTQATPPPSHSQPLGPFHAHLERVCVRFSLVPDSRPVRATSARAGGLNWVPPQNSYVKALTPRTPRSDWFGDGPSKREQTLSDVMWTGPNPAGLVSSEEIRTHRAIGKVCAQGDDQ